MRQKLETLGEKKKKYAWTYFRSSSSREREGGEVQNEQKIKSTKNGMPVCTGENLFNFKLVKLYKMYKMLVQ